MKKCVEIRTTKRDSIRGKRINDAMEECIRN